MNSIQVKICGVTNLEDARECALAGADWLGFIFVPHTPRFVSPDVAKNIITALKKDNVAAKFVGVFADQPIEEIRYITEFAQLDKVQLHGDEPNSYFQELGKNSWKALRPRNESELQEKLAQYRKELENNEPAFLIDSFDARKIGGTGAPANWELAYLLARRYPIFLAGGLTPDNVEEAIRAVTPWGVDTSSGVEKSPGIKDHLKIRQFCRAAKGIGR